MSPAEWGHGDTLSPTRLSLKISGTAKDRFEELEQLLWHRARRRPTHNEIINYLFDNQKDQVSAVHLEINYVERKIRDNCPPEIHEPALKTIAQLRRIVSRTPDELPSKKEGKK